MEGNHERHEKGSGRNIQHRTFNAQHPRFKANLTTKKLRKQRRSNLKDRKERWISRKRSQRKQRSYGFNAKARINSEEAKGTRSGKKHPTSNIERPTSKV
jgi:hypothetical protein